MKKILILLLCLSLLTGCTPMVQPDEDNTEVMQPEPPTTSIPEPPTKLEPMPVPPSSEKELPANIPQEPPMSYEEYFSEERAFVRNTKDIMQDRYLPIIAVGQEYLERFGPDVWSPDYPFLMDRLYVRDLVEERFILLLDEIVLGRAVVKDELYCILGDGRIVSVDLNGNITNTFYTKDPADTEELSDIYATDTLIFFRKGYSIYRLYIPTGQVDTVFTSENLRWYKPTSNITLEWRKAEQTWLDANPEWVSTHGSHACGMKCAFADIPPYITYIHNAATLQCEERTWPASHAGADPVDIPLDGPCG